MKILLIGARGQLGTDIQKVIPKSFLIPLTRDDIQVENQESIFSNISKIRPDIVINTSAFHKVDVCEDSIKESFLVNTFAIEYLAKACLEHKCALVHISTDYVFGADEARTSPYSEVDREGPISVYGLSKLAGEKFLQYKMTNFFLIRSAGLFGVAGSSGKGGNFVETMIRLGKEKGKVSVVNDQYTSPTYTLNLAENIWKLIQTRHYGLYHMTSEGDCSWYEFANTIFNILKMDVECTPCSTAQFPTRARRPKYSVLENSRLKALGLNSMNHWKENLEFYLSEKGHIHTKS